MDRFFFFFFSLFFQSSVSRWLFLLVAQYNNPSNSIPSLLDGNSSSSGCGVVSCRPLSTLSLPLLLFFNKSWAGSCFLLLNINLPNSVPSPTRSSCLQPVFLVLHNPIHPTLSIPLLVVAVMASRRPLMSPSLFPNDMFFQFRLWLAGCCIYCCSVSIIHPTIYSFLGSTQLLCDVLPPPPRRRWQRQEQRYCHGVRFDADTHFRMTRTRLSVDGLIVSSE